MANKKVVDFYVSVTTKQALIGLAAIRVKDVPAVAVGILELMLDAVAKEPRVLTRLRNREKEDLFFFLRVSLAGKHFRFAMELASACGLTLSELFSLLLETGMDYYPRAGSVRKEDVINAIRSDCILRYSRLA